MSVFMAVTIIASFSMDLKYTSAKKWSTTEPTIYPTAPSKAPSVATRAPTKSTDVPTETPTQIPSDIPTETPTHMSSDIPTELPTLYPTEVESTSSNDKEVTEETGANDVRITGENDLNEITIEDKLFENDLLIYIGTGGGISLLCIGLLIFILCKMKKKQNVNKLNSHSRESTQSSISNMQNFKNRAIAERINNQMYNNIETATCDTDTDDNVKLNPIVEDKAFIPSLVSDYNVITESLQQTAGRSLTNDYDHDAFQIGNASNDDIVNGSDSEGDNKITPFGGNNDNKIDNAMLIFCNVNDVNNDDEVIGNDYNDIIVTPNIQLQNIQSEGGEQYHKHVKFQLVDNDDDNDVVIPQLQFEMTISINYKPILTLGNIEETCTSIGHIGDVDNVALILDVQNDKVIIGDDEEDDQKDTPCMIDDDNDIDKIQITDDGDSDNEIIGDIQNDLQTPQTSINQNKSIDGLSDLNMQII